MEPRDIEEWTRRLREQGVPDSLIDDAKEAAARMAAAAGIFEHDPTEPLDPGALAGTLSRPWESDA